MPGNAHKPLSPQSSPTACNVVGAPMAVHDPVQVPLAAVLQNAPSTHSLSNGRQSAPSGNVPVNTRVHGAIACTVHQAPPLSGTPAESARVTEQSWGAAAMQAAAATGS